MKTVYGLVTYLVSRVYAGIRNQTRPTIAITPLQAGIRRPAPDLSPGAGQRRVEAMFWNRWVELHPLAPASDHQLTGWLFLRLLALIYFAAFYSLSGQIVGLVGEQGILPFQTLLEDLKASPGGLAWWQLPTLFWIESGDNFLYAATIAGCLISLLLFFNLLPRIALILLFLLYLSLYHAGQLFLEFQWDYLLLECGFLAIFLVNGPSRLLLFMFHWLLFRLRLLSGISKLLSGDPSWSGLTALNHYFETQPLPHAGAWYFHQLPEWLLQAGVLLLLFSELIVPLFIFLSRRYRMIAAAVTLAIQLLIIATSNHNFINLLTILLCLFLLDDTLLKRLLPGRFSDRSTGRSGEGVLARGVLGLAATLILITSLTLAFQMISGRAAYAPLRVVAVGMHRFGLGNVYHIFPTMQTERQELVIEGSRDGVEWQPYRFRYKPGALDRMTPFIVPHQPRLDWMIWFVPTQNPAMQHWFESFLWRLRQNSPAVTGLLQENPFATEGPSYLRVAVWRYRFTSWEQRRALGEWWQAEYLGIFPQTQARRP